MPDPTLPHRRHRSLARTDERAEQTVERLTAPLPAELWTALAGAGRITGEVAA